MRRMERRLIKTGRTEEFKKAVSRQSLEEFLGALPKELPGAHKSPGKYITMVEAYEYKTGSYATTLLRICMIYSMKQPLQ
jgi:hypothetical protein